MTVYISLRAQVHPLAGQQAYDRGMQISLDSLNSYGGQQLIGIMSLQITQIDAVLVDVQQGHPKDKFNRKITLRTQAQELQLLMESTLRMEKLIRFSLNSDNGRLRWDNGRVRLRNRIASVAEECDKLNQCAKRIQTQFVVVRKPIDKENTERLTPILGSYLVIDLLRIIGQYMD